MEKNKKNLSLADKFEFPIIQEQTSCGCGTSILPNAVRTKPRLDQYFVSGSMTTPVGELPKVSSALTRHDRWGIIKMRLGAGRTHYTIDPGLYALGHPDAQAPILVTANYKMSFDYLRQALADRNAWILVLDTKGINVWCAAKNIFLFLHCYAAADGKNYIWFFSF